MTKSEIVKAARAVWRIRQPEISRRIQAGDARRAIENRRIEWAVGIDDDEPEECQRPPSAFDQGATGNGYGSCVSRAYEQRRERE